MYICVLRAVIFLREWGSNSLITQVVPRNFILIVWDFYRTHMIREFQILTHTFVVSAPDGNCPENAAFHAKERIYRLAWMFYVSIVSGVGALTVIGMVVGCDQIVVAFVAGRKGADGSEAQEDIQAKLPLLAARCVALGIGMGILSLLPGHNIDSNGAIWLLGLAVVLLAISRIAEMGE